MGFILLDNGKELKSLTDFNYFIIVSILLKVLYLVEQMGWLGL